MQLEVEQKHELPDLPAFEARLAELGVAIKPAELHVDRYFNHPRHDFAQTDEALRIRSIGSANYITYKGPKLDLETKTRHEIELPLPAGSDQASAFAELLLQLGFRDVAIVNKSRRNFQLMIDHILVTGTIDEVAGLGNYVELEVVTDPNGLEVSRQAVASCAERLSLGLGERRSYLELLLAQE